MQHRNVKTPLRRTQRGFQFWRRPTLARPIAVLPSGLQRFTAVFGMGTGGATALLSPECDAGLAVSPLMRRGKPTPTSGDAIDLGRSEGPRSIVRSLDFARDDKIFQRTNSASSLISTYRKFSFRGQRPRLSAFAKATADKQL